MNSLKPTMREVLEGLRPGDSKLLEASAEVLGSHARGEGEQHVPWFVRALTAVSAWIAATLLLTFIFGIKLVSSAGGSIALGIVIIAGAALVQRFQGKRLFLEQLAFALSLAGQVLFISGIGRETSDEGGALATIFVSIVLIFLYPDRNHRFLSTLIAVAGAVYFVYEVRISYGLQVLAACLAAGGAHLWFQESTFLSGDTEEVMRPVAYGLVAAFLFLLIPSIMPPEFNQPGIARNWVPTTIAATAVLLLLEYRLLSFHNNQGGRKLTFLMFGGTLALAAASLNAPGILSALLVLVTGFHRGNRILTGLAVVFLAVFVSAYYYNMDMTLLTKSWALLATGAILLLLRPLLVKAIGSANVEVAND
jgi:uncharacterized membrane protein